MATKAAYLTIEQRIQREIADLEQEVADLEARTTELHIALKVVHEFGADEKETATNGAETKRMIIKPNEDLPEAVKSRLGQGSEVADETFELERN